MLEDFLVNDKQLLRLEDSSNDARTCLAVLLIGQSTFGNILSTKKLGWGVEGFCEELHNGTPATELITKVVSTDFVYCKGKFYQWNETCW